MARTSTSIRLPEELIEALDRRAAALGLTRSQLIVRAVEKALEDQTEWSPGFLKAISASHPTLDEAVDEMMQAIRTHRSRNEVPDL